MNEIKMIEVEKLRPHADNPRKDLGDLTELAESIKKQGVFQNLTVVPCSGGVYTVIIGHRRLAAAKLAGVKELPCAVCAMSEKEQLATMLSENMQRSDLTVCEQAEGIQMMLDLGESVKGVSEQTGLSESTVRRRVKILKLGREELREAQMRGGTLDDYEKLLNIEDEEDRNDALAAIGTRDFEWKLKMAEQNQKRRQRRKEIADAVKTFAEEVQSAEDCADCEYVTSYYAWNNEAVKIPEDKDEREYRAVFSRDGVSIYKKPTEDELAREDEEERKRRQTLERAERRCGRLQERFNAMTERRE